MVIKKFDEETHKLTLELDYNDVSTIYNGLWSSLNPDDARVLATLGSKESSEAWFSQMAKTFLNFKTLFHLMKGGTVSALNDALRRGDNNG